MSVFDQTRAKANRVFISYSSIDRVRTKGLGLLLESLGHQVFHDHRTIKPGMRWEAALQEGLDEADAVMVFWTKHAARSDWVRKEYEYFHATYPDRLLVPVLGDETPPTPILKTRQQADFAPIVNEILDTKRRMKREGASAGEIQSAVTARLEQAGIDVKSKHKRMRVFLLLGFGWLRTLLNYPWAATQQLGSGAVEKAAQLSLGHVATLGLVGALGVAGGATLNTTAAEPPDLPRWANELNDSVSIMGGDVRALSSTLLASRDAMTGRIAGVVDSLSQIDRRITTINETREEVVRHLFTVLEAVRDSDSLAAVLQACRDTTSQLTQTLARVATPGTVPEESPIRPTPDEGVVAPSVTLPGVEFEPPEGSGTMVDPVPLVAPMPPIPRDLRDQGTQEDVMVAAVIDTAGAVTVESVSGPEALQAAAREAVSQWQFEPGKRDGIPMQWRMTVPVKFSYGIEFALPPGEGSLVEPQPLSAPYPEYPRQAIARRIEGTVLVSAAVQPDGSVVVQQVEGDDTALNEAARQAVERWRFTAGTRNGIPVEWEFTVPVTFRLRT